MFAINIIINASLLFTKILKVFSVLNLWKASPSFQPFEWIRQFDAADVKRVKCG